MTTDVLSSQATDDLFKEWQGTYSDKLNLPALHTTTKLWTPGYNPTEPATHRAAIDNNCPPILHDCGVAVIGRTASDLSNVKLFLDGYSPEFGFQQYLNDPTQLTEGTQLAKFAGQLCYLSMGEKRTYNKDASRYIGHIKESGHGSVFEHVYYNFLFYGISRSNTHELVRHRPGMAYSQISQRYVSGRALRFVMRPEFIGDTFLQTQFVERCKRNFREYEELGQYLVKLQEQGGKQILSADQKTDLKKKVQQVSRCLLPNETEAPIVVSANARSARHLIEMRANASAETEIRRAWFKVFLCVRQIDPEIFEDYEAVKLNDGTFAVQTKYRKV